MTQETVELVEDTGQAVKYTVLEKSLIGNEIFEEGSTCSYAGLPSENLAPQCDIGKARFQEYLRTNKERQAKMKAEFAEQNGVGIDSAVFAAAIAKAIEESRAGEDERVAKIVAAVLAAQKTAETPFA